MKWTIHELIKNQKMNNTFEETLDLSNFIDNTDIVRISAVDVSGEYEIYDNEEFVFYLSIRCTLIMQCAITLKDVEYPMDLEVEEVFTTYKDEETTKIEGITIDLLPIIWSNILLEKPMRVVSENAYDEVDYENETFEDEERVNTVFASLKKHKK
jgi:uncharacterized protein